MDMKSTPPEIKELLGKPLSRGDFLKVAGVGMLTVFGAGNFITYLKASQVKPQQHVATKQTDQSNGGFGSRKFGI